MKQSLCLLEIESLFAVNRGSIRGHAAFFLVFFLTKNRTAKRTPPEGGSTACLSCVCNARKKVGEPPAEHI